jgi:2,4-dienoyl-CoA reductase-like NADH-dependent reductase (Old Yellow Enzyme family)
MPSDRPTTPPLLFSPLALRGVTLPNRVVISPMVQYRATDGLVNDFHIAHLGKFALGRAGTVFTEATAVEPRGRVTPGDLGLWHDAQIPGMRRLTDYLRLEGSIPAIQLAHAGRKGSGQRAIDGNGPLSATESPWETVGPTTEPVTPAWPAPHAVTPAEIARITAEFAAAARRADAAGFDIAEIHGAHGYLIATFLSPISNTRNDEYGGDRAGRMRIALEITRAVRAVWPDHKPLFFRISALDGAEGGWSLEDSVVLSAALKTLGVDVIDCSSGGLTGSATAATIPRHPGFQVPFASEIRRRTGVATQAVGLILDGPQAEAILQKGDADLIAIGRQALFDPFWALHAAAALGADTGFALWPEEYGWWLEKRSRSLQTAKV